MMTDPVFDRRDLLKLGGVGAATAFVSGCQPPTRGPESVVDEAVASPVGSGFELEETTVADLQAAMEEGSHTAASIAELYIGRIEALDLEGPAQGGGGGPALRSVLEVNPDALEIAGTLDRERAAGRTRGPLHGVPVLIKDNIDTADKMQTTAGSLALAGTRAAEDSTVARKLRAAGAVILGKTNLSEWANFRSERSSSGWSGRGGQTRNPYALDRNPCGSSSGSGVAASANLCAVAIGTETNGSVVCPANANGLVGVKPTLGLVSRAGIVPIAHSQDTAGPMTRTVADAAILLGALTGADPRDPITAEPAERGAVDYTGFLRRDGLEGARLGVWRERFGFHERVDAALESAIEAMKEAGAEVIDPIEMPSFDDLGSASYDVLLYEFKADLAAYLATRGPDTRYRTLAELIAFNEEHAAESMPYFQQEIFLKAEEKGPLTEPEYLDSLAKCRRLTRDEGIDRVVGEHRLDAILAPTGGPAWVTDLINGDRFGGGSSSAAAISGYANITVPAGFVYGLPVGMSFIGPAFSEPTLFRLAYAFEQKTRARRPPHLLPTVDLESQAVG